MKPNQKNPTIPALAWLVASGLLLTGCSGLQIGNSLLPGSSQVESTSPETSDGGVISPEPPLGYDADFENPIKTPYLETILTTRSDEHGEYAVTKINYPSIDMVKNKGVSKSELSSALKFYTDFVSTEVLDSIAFDDYSQYETWVETVAPKYIVEDYFNDIVNAQKNGSYAGLIFNNIRDPKSDNPSDTNIVPVLIRDGGPRVYNKNINYLEASYSNGGLFIEGRGAAILIVDDKNHLEWFQKISGGMSGEYFPEFQGGINDVAPIVFTVGLALVPDGDSWKIAAFRNDFSVPISKFSLPADPKVLELRTQIK
jgi:hypothetical protein